MMKTKIRASALAVALSLSVVYARTKDVAFPYRMGAGFQGEPNRSMFGAVIEPELINTTTPPLFYGCAVVVDTTTNSVRALAAGDTALTSIYGVTVRPFPTQQASTSTNWGQIALGTPVAPPSSGVLDVMREGYIFVKVNAGTATKKGPAYVWVAASSGNHVQGGFEATATGGSTIAITNAWFNGPADAAGIAELFITAVN